VGGLVSIASPLSVGLSVGGLVFNLPSLIVSTGFWSSKTLTLAEAGDWKNIPRAREASDSFMMNDRY